MYLGVPGVGELSGQLLDTEVGLVGDAPDLVLDLGHVLNGAVQVLEHHCQVLEPCLQSPQGFGVFRVGLGINIVKKYPKIRQHRELLQIRKERGPGQHCSIHLVDPALSFSSFLVY